MKEDEDESLSVHVDEGRYGRGSVYILMRLDEDESVYI